MDFVEKKEVLPMINRDEQLFGQIAKYLVQEQMIKPEEQVRFLKLLEEECP